MTDIAEVIFQSDKRQASNKEAIAQGLGRHVDPNQRRCQVPGEDHGPLTAHKSGTTLVCTHRYGQGNLCQYEEALSLADGMADDSPFRRPITRLVN